MSSKRDRNPAYISGKPLSQHNRLGGRGGGLLWFNTPAVLPHHGTNPPNCQTTAACAKKRFVSGSAEVSLVVECHRLWISRATEQNTNVSLWLKEGRMHVHEGLGCFYTCGHTAVKQTPSLWSRERAAMVPCSLANLEKNPNLSQIHFHSNVHGRWENLFPSITAITSKSKKLFFSRLHIQLLLALWCPISSTRSVPME